MIARRLRGVEARRLRAVASSADDKSESKLNFLDLVQAQLIVCAVV